jgi:hypothetical protein
MDLSKLPKLSDTKGQTAAENPDAPSPVVPQAAACYPVPPRRPGVGVDIWISLIIGILLLSLGGTFGRFLVAKISHQPFHTGVNWQYTDTPKDGTEVDYFDLQGYTAWSDMGIFLFGLILLFEACSKTLLVLKPGKISRAVLMLAIVLTALAVVLNIIACAKLMSISITPILSGLAVAFGGWVLFEEYTALRAMTPVTPV